MKVVCNTIDEIKTPIPLEEIHECISKSHKKYLFKPFVKCIQDFNLVEEGDKIAVCISGGKDSILLAKLFEELKRHRQINFELKFICMDPGYTKENLDLIKYNFKHLNLDVIIKKSNYFNVVEKIAKENPCYLCARMRRGFLYDMAQKEGCNKIALAHHFDDIIETTLINMFYGSQFKTMVPKIKSKNFENMTLIRPLSYVKESDIVKFINKINMTCLNCGCTVAALKTASKRHEVKELIANLRKVSPDIDQSIFNSATNVVIDAVLGYTKNGVRHNFDDIFKDNVLKDEDDE